MELAQSLRKLALQAPAGLAAAGPAIASAVL